MSDRFGQDAGGESLVAAADEALGEFDEDEGEGFDEGKDEC